MAMLTSGKTINNYHIAFTEYQNWPFEKKAKTARKKKKKLYIYIYIHHCCDYCTLISNLFMNTYEKYEFE